jgi:hypothetical protein
MSSITNNPYATAAQNAGYATFKSAAKSVFAEPEKTVYDRARDASQFPIACPPSLAAGEMGNMNIGNNMYTGLTMTFTKITKITPYEVDQFNKQKASVGLGVEDCMQLDSLAMDLKDYLTSTFSDKQWAVRSPHYKCDVRLGWPTYRGQESQVKIINGSKTEYVNMDAVNKMIGFNNLTPKAVGVHCKLWLRGDSNENGEGVVYTVGFYYTLDSLTF